MMSQLTANERFMLFVNKQPDGHWAFVKGKKYLGLKSQTYAWRFIYKRPLSDHHTVVPICCDPLCVRLEHISPVNAWTKK